MIVVDVIAVLVVGLYVAGAVLSLAVYWNVAGFAGRMGRWEAVGSALTWPSTVVMLVRSTRASFVVGMRGGSQDEVLRAGMEAARQSSMAAHPICVPGLHRFLRVPPPVAILCCERCSRTPEELGLDPAVVIARDFDRSA